MSDPRPSRPRLTAAGWVLVEHITHIGGCSRCDHHTLWLKRRGNAVASICAACRHAELFPLRSTGHPGRAGQQVGGNR